MPGLGGIRQARSQRCHAACIQHGRAAPLQLHAGLGTLRGRPRTQQFPRHFRQRTPQGGQAVETHGVVQRGGLEFLLLPGGTEKIKQHHPDGWLVRRMGQQVPQIGLCTLGIPIGKPDSRFFHLGFMHKNRLVFARKTRCPGRYAPRCQAQLGQTYQTRIAPRQLQIPCGQHGVPVRFGVVWQRSRFGGQVRLPRSGMGWILPDRLVAVFMGFPPLLGHLLFNLVDLLEGARTVIRGP